MGPKRYVDALIRTWFAMLVTPDLQYMQKHSVLLPIRNAPRRLGVRK